MLALRFRPNWLGYGGRRDWQRQVRVVSRAEVLVTRARPQEA